MSKPQPHRARKRFGQNFLRDETVVEHIVAAVSPSTTDHVVEIGPGQGALTGALLASHCRLDAIELDRDLAPALVAAFGRKSTFRLHQADALAFDFTAIADKENPMRVVGNLPYNISTPLMFRLLEHMEIIRDMHFMLQLEVVQRLAAEPGGKEWGRLGIMTQYYCEVESLFEVPPDAFSPPPRVRSAVVRLVPRNREERTRCDPWCLSRVVKAAFAQRRKTLRNNMKGLFDEAGLTTLGIDPATRAETLSLTDYIRLANALDGT